jgi:ferrochelatase
MTAADGTGQIGVVVMAYGTPRSPDEILPYYTDIRRGRPPTDEQLAGLARRYEAIGGLSPLLERSAAQQRAVQAELDTIAPGRYRVVLGLKHAAPTIEDTVATLAAGGVERAVGLVLAPHYSAYSVGQYLDRLANAAQSHGLVVTGVESWATEPALVEFLAGEVKNRLAGLPDSTRVVFTAHSLPSRIVESGDPYPGELAATATAVAERAGLERSTWEIGWQSAGRTPEPWLGPDILEIVDRLASERVGGVLVCACGFVADHLEVLYDIDIEARRRAESHGVAFERTACVNDHPAVMAALARRVDAASRAAWRS